MLVIGTYWPGEVVLDRHPLRREQDLQAHHLCAELPLGLLDEAGVQAFLDTRLGPHALPSDFARLLHERPMATRCSWSRCSAIWSMASASVETT